MRTVVFFIEKNFKKNIFIVGVVVVFFFSFFLSSSLFSFIYIILINIIFYK